MNFRLTSLAFFFSCAALAQSSDHKIRYYDLHTGYEIRHMVIDSIDFQYIQNKRLDTVRIWTADLKFKTPENYRIGTKLKSLPQNVKSSLLKFDARGYVVRTLSGWDLFFCEGLSCTGEAITPDSEVKWIEKRKS